ncbi:hypothetical protein SSPO_075990 [Streptomyces antimycoticus]|uniref:Uncharacterized protein n=1 Tax=Streptomyces antimycoticus TaxID=68175 RepID=A0A499V5Q0_9ACTN|nr:hypothetical protein SSPO_075990 [Streptomyces antimycoticus]
MATVATPSRPLPIVTKRCTSAATTTTSSGSANQNEPCSQCSRRTLGRTATRTTSRAASSSISATAASAPTTDQGVQVTSGPAGPGAGSATGPLGCRFSSYSAASSLPNTRRSSARWSRERRSRSCQCSS